MASTTGSNDNRSISSEDSRRSKSIKEVEEQDPPPTQVNLEPMYAQDASIQEVPEENPTLGATPKPNVVPGSIPKKKSQSKKENTFTKETELDYTEATEDPTPKNPFNPRSVNPSARERSGFWIQTLPPSLVLPTQPKTTTS